MRVTGLLFNPPGKGEFLRKHVEMDDSLMPKTVKEFADRSFLAIKHFWPQAQVPVATVVQKCGNEGKRVVVESGDLWSVEWADDAHINWMRDFTSKYTSGQISSADYMDVVMKNQVTNEVRL